jgi:hypothetical protein
MNNRPESFLHLLGSLTSGVAAITAKQEQIDWALRQGAATIAIVAGSATIWSIFFRKQNNRD